MIKENHAVARIILTKHCPTCGARFSGECEFNLRFLNNANTPKALVGEIVIDIVNLIDKKCPSTCPSCSKKDFKELKISYTVDD